MKISYLATSGLVLCAGVAEAFAPRAFTQRVQLSPLFVATEPTATSDAKLGLEYPAISPFGKGQDTGSSDKNLLGGKGANLAVMTSIGLSVPPGFTITTECCDRFCNAWSMEMPDKLWDEVKASLKAVEEEMDATFGSAKNPLLLSVRSGAAISMPVRKSECLLLNSNAIGGLHLTIIPHSGE
jgi:hypothetical protein